MTMSTPYGLPSTCSSIQHNSISRSSGLYASAPSTPKPPARLTAATTSRQCENAKIGNSMSSRSAMGVRTRNPPSGKCRCEVGERQHVDRVGEHVHLQAVLQEGER